MPRPPNRSPQTRLVLAALLQQPTEWRHGYDLSKQTDLPSGTLYPILVRLAEQGVLQETWEPSDAAGRPPRHSYRLTAFGITTARELLRDNRATVRRLRPSRATP
jgi:PadR family transcriptional regulator, regulatory protein PadR